MKKNYKIDFTAMTITITKAFSELAQDPTSKEFQLLITLKSELPTFRIVTPAPKTRKTDKITYAKMEKYIKCQMDATILMKRFVDIKELSKATPSPYYFVSEWFNKTFPTYGDLPKFDNHGNIIPEYDLVAAGIATPLEEVKPNAA